MIGEKEELKNLIKEFLEKCIILLRSTLDLHKPTISNVREKIKLRGWDKNNHGTETNHILEISPFLHTIRIEKDITSLQEYKKLCEFLISHKILIEEKDQYDIEARTKDYILRILWFIVKEEDCYNIKNINLENFFDGFWNYAKTKQTTTYSFMPLVNFEGDFDILHINSDVRIRKLDPKEIEYYINNYDITYNNMKFIPYFSYVLEMDITSIKKYQNEHHTFAIEKFSEIITSLNIFKNGSVVPFKVFSQTITWEPFGGTMSNLPYIDIFLAGGYKLEASEVSNFLNFYQGYKKVKEKNRLIDLPLKRLNLYHSRRDREDQILDLFVGFESVLLPDSDTEVSYRLSIRFAHFLAENNDERKKLFDFMKNAYIIRSKIIHGKSVDINNKLKKMNIASLEEFKNYLSEYYIRVLKKYIEISETGQEVDKNYLNKMLLSK